MRTNSCGVTEVAHLRTDKEKYDEGYDRIFGKKEEKVENQVQESPATEEKEPEMSFVSKIVVYGLSKENGYQFGTTFDNPIELEMSDKGILDYLKSTGLVKTEDRDFFVVAECFDSIRQYDLYNNDVREWYINGCDPDEKPTFHEPDHFWFLHKG